jgi:hypothetical protein
MRLPEQMAHRGQKIQFEIVAVLALLALFTHNHAFWIAGLLLALIPLPDFTTPLSSIAGSLERIAGSTGSGRLRRRLHGKRLRRPATGPSSTRG